MLHGGFWSAGLAGGGTRASKDKSGTSLAGILADEVGVVAETGWEVVDDRADAKFPVEPAEVGPLRLVEPDGIAKGANDPFDCWVGPCERIAATV